jgi:hypothetical protein
MTPKKVIGYVLIAAIVPVIVGGYFGFVRKSPAPAPPDPLVLGQSYAAAYNKQPGQYQITAIAACASKPGDVNTFACFYLLKTVGSTAAPICARFEVTIKSYDAKAGRFGIANQTAAAADRSYCG